MARLNTPPRPELRWRQLLDDHVIALGWSPDGSTIAAASVAGPVTLFHVSTGGIHQALPGHGFGTTALSWHPGGKRLATAGQDGKVRIWDTATGQPMFVLDGGAAWVERVAWGSKGDYLATAAGKKLRLWDTEGNLVHAYPDATHTIADLAWTPRGTELAVAGFGGVTFYRGDANEPVNRFEWKGSLLALAWSPDGKMLAGGGLDASVHFWYVKSGEDLQMSGYPTKVRELAWDPTSSFLATGGGEAVVAWDCRGDGPAGSTPIVLELHSRPITAVAYQRRGPVLASAAGDGKIGFWFPAGSKKPLSRADFGEGVSTLAWSPGDGRLAVGGEGGAIGMFTV